MFMTKFLYTTRNSNIPIKLKPLHLFLEKFFNSAHFSLFFINYFYLSPGKLLCFLGKKTTEKQISAIAANISIN